MAGKTTADGEEPNRRAADLPSAFSAITKAWFASSFAAPTTAQIDAWAAIERGDNTLVVAPTGSGKTLAAFLWALDHLANAPAPEPAARCRVLYISPLKALAVDVERNLRSPLVGMRHAATRLGLPEPSVEVAIRSGDTPADQRRRIASKPPDILITTPESLFLMLTSAARASLRSVETVIVDEVHAVAGTKRGAHLALCLERLDVVADKPAQRIGLSATVRPVDEIARFLGGWRPATVVQPPSPKTFDITVVVPVEDMGAPDEIDDDQPKKSIWPHVEERIADLVDAHRSTIVFANSRRLAERLTNRLNEIGFERGRQTEIARAHHGSVSREQRSITEELLKSGQLPAVVATSSLELGIDMGAVDLVVQVESPPSVASGLQRIGRAGHQVGAVSHGVIFPKYRGDLVPTAVVAERMKAGAIEAIRMPRNPLDVLAQHLVSMTAMQPWQVDDALALARKAAPFATLPQSAFDAVLDMLAGRYPSDEFAELRPRLVWDRVAGTITGRPGAQRLAVTSGGTIPDRGLFGVFLAGVEKASRVGELDEEMVYESRVGDVFTLGSSSWRIVEITHDRVLVTPAPGVPGKLPFWHGDALGRPLELGRALGAFTRELSALERPDAHRRLLRAGLDGWAADNLLSYLSEQREACGQLPDDRTIVVERFRDELGDWRVVVHSPFGAQVHAPWALAIAAKLREQYGVDVSAMHADDGIVVRIPETDEAPPAQLAALGSDEVNEIVTREVGGSALFAARFRECAARALLLPRRRPDRRTPLWQQRQRSAQLLAVASEYGSFPIVLETMRECLQDVFDLAGLIDLMRDVEARRVRFVDVETPAASPFARSLLFGYIATFIYEGDAPLAERRAQALALDAALLGELLGQAELREILDADAIDDVERDLQRLSADRQARDVEGVADLLRLLGPLSSAAAIARGATAHSLADLEAARRAIRVRIAGEQRWAAIEDAGRLRDALGIALPVGIPAAFAEPVVDPLGDLVARDARTHGPFTTADVAGRLGLGTAVVAAVLERLAASGRVTRGEFRPGSSGIEWCDANVLRQIRRKSMAKLRKDVEPVPAAALGRFLPAWQHAGRWFDRTGLLRGLDGVLRAVEQLQGLALPASALEPLVLSSRVADYQPSMLDELTTSGELVWAGRGSLPGNDGWISLYPAENAALLLPAREPGDASSPLAAQVIEALGGAGGLFFREISARLGANDDRALADAIWQLVWSGRVTNDSLAPLRVMLGAGRPRHRPTTAARRGRPVLPARNGPPTVAGRWSLLPEPSVDATRRSHALAETLLDRYGIVTRGAVQAEGIAGGFAVIYRVLTAFEESGRCRRGYFVDGLGAAQFALPGAVDRLRTPPGRTDALASNHADASSPRALVLAATDPANPYGAALSWPLTPNTPTDRRGHRPGRKAGALVVLVNGELVLYVERGGKTLLTFGSEAGDRGARQLDAAADALALAVRDGWLGRLDVERADGGSVLTSPLATALETAGFRVSPRGLRLRS
jgi:ATP-dependent helicase Lhr and Lhr-like helicase